MMKINRFNKINQFDGRNDQFRRRHGQLQLQEQDELAKHGFRYLVEDFLQQLRLAAFTGPRQQPVRRGERAEPHLEVRIRYAG